MAYAGWGSNLNSSMSLGSTGVVGAYGSWDTGASGTSSQSQHQDEAQFNSLHPVGGLVTGDQVKPVFQASGLPSAQLAQIWSTVDQDHDGKINKTQYCSAMQMIRQVKQQGNLLSKSLPQSMLSSFSGVTTFSGTSSFSGNSNLGGNANFSQTPNFGTPNFSGTPNVGMTSSFPTGSENMSKSWSLMGMANSVTPLSPSVSGPVSVANQGWDIKPQEMRKYVMEFNTLDVSKTGYISGGDARIILTKSGLDKGTLAQIWSLSDIDKDGRLSCDEYAIAMHLMSHVKGGVSLPSTLPPELYPGPVKYHTVDRVASKAKKVSMTGTSDQTGGVKGLTRTSSGGHKRTASGGGHTRNPSGGVDNITFEDKRKENFEAGRMELERRRKAKREQQEKEMAEKERKKREEEERRFQQQRDAELAQQAELERQRRKAMEIELERERQMMKLAIEREKEQRELERKRKEEWTRKRRIELEGQRDWEKKSLYSLRVQHSQLEDQLRQLDQRKVGAQASTERQKSISSKITLDLRTMRLSHDVRRAELTKLQSELNGFHTQLSSLQRERRELRESLQARSPEMSLYQQQRQQLKDKIIGLAASLAGLRSNLTHNSKSIEEVREVFKTNSQLLEDLKTTYQSDEVKVTNLRQQVLARQHAFEEAQRIELEEAKRREEEEREEREVRNRTRREVEEKAKREARLEKIKMDQEAALKKVKLQTVMAQAAAQAASPNIITTAATPPPTPNSKDISISPSPLTTKPAIPTKPSKLKSPPNTPQKSPPSTPQKPPDDVSNLDWMEESERVWMKVRELQKRRAELQKQREQGNPVKPPPYKARKLDKQETVEKELKSKGKQDMSTKAVPRESTEKEPKGKFLKGRKAKKDKEPTVTTDSRNQLLDLDSSWDSTAQTAPGISSFAKDTSQILQPLKSVPEDNEVDEDRMSAGRNSVSSPDPKPRDNRSRSASLSPQHKLEEKPMTSRYSVAALSELFNKGLTNEFNAGCHGWSSDIRKPSSPDENESTSPNDNAESACQNIPSDYDNVDEATIEPVEPSTTPNVPEETSYQVIYDYEATDNTELTIKEGDIVTFILREDTSPGWIMVRLEGGAEGWVPELYLQILQNEVAGEDVASDLVEGGLVRETGQVISPDTQRQAEVRSPLMQAQVIYSWEGTKANHLSLFEGEVIRVLQRSEKWWSGEYNGCVGWFPKTYVKLLDTTEPTSGGLEPTSGEPTVSGDGVQADVLYEAIYDYEGEAEGDLTFQIGDIIKVTSSAGVWWTGDLNGVTGTFPSNYVQLKEELPRSPAPPSPASSRKTDQSSLTKPVIARVKITYHSSRKGQLSLQPGQLVKVFKQAENGWWEGELQSRGKKRAVGWFPANRVELLPQRQQSSIGSSPSHSLGSGGVESKMPRARSPLLEVLEEPKYSSVNLVLALYTYTAQSADELTFHKGSVITVLGKEGEWWKGEINENIGLFPSNYVQPLTDQQASPSEPSRWADSVSPEVLAAVSDKERKRQEAIFELLTSERHYVDSLKLVKEVFFDPMIQEEVLTEEEMAKVMVNWDELIQCSSDLLSSFLVRLRTSGALVRAIGDVLASQIPKLTPHIRWCGCQLNACLLLQQKSSDPKFKEFEQKCSTNPRTGGLPLSSFLLKPMQRVTKYPLLVTRIMDYTSPSNSDYMDLKSALTEAQTLCEHVNDGVRQKENTEQLEWLQSHVSFTNLEEKLVFNSQTNFMGPRKLLHWGKFFKIRGSKDLVGFLFNDFLLLVRPKFFFPKIASPADLEPWGKNEFQIYRKPYLLDELKARKSGSDNSGAMLNLIQSSPEDKDILLRVETEQSRDQWVKKLTKASLDFMTTKKKMDREKQEQYMRTLRDSVGELDVTVVEGSDLLAKDPNSKSDPFCVVRFGDQQPEQTTRVIHSSLNPKWNHTMQFQVYDINEDTLEITVFDKDLFSPNHFLGFGHVSLKDLLDQKDSPWEKNVLLENVARGEITLKIALKLKKSDLLL